MRWDQVGQLPCSVARSLSVVGDRWTLLVLRDVFLGARRFEQLRASLGPSPRLLQDRLERLVAHGILERRVYQERPERHEYQLTEKGRDLYPVIAALLAWGDRWMADEDGPPVRLVHRRCGHATHAVATCAACGEALAADEVRIAPRTD